MADASVVHIGENSPEKVALKLLEVIANIEHVSLSSSDKSELKHGWTKADRKWVLGTYNECIEAVRGFRSKSTKWPSETAGP
jgi:hypothetical protein